MKSKPARKLRAKVGVPDSDAKLNPPPTEAEEKALRALTPFPLLRVRHEKKGQITLGERRLERRQIRQIKEQKNSILKDLLYYADGGDAEAVALLATFATDAILILRVLAERQPEVLRPLTRKSLVWPELIGKHPDTKRQHDRILKKLEIGSESVDGWRWSESSPATQQALYMRAWLETNKSVFGLPDLTRETRELWFKVGWKCVLAMTNDKPEEDEFLSQIGQHRAKHSEHEGQQKRATKRTSAANVRDGIKKGLKQSFWTLTNRYPPK